jgi:hypothetical protein
LASAAVGEWRQAERQPAERRYRWVKLHVTAVRSRTRSRARA